MRVILLSRKPAFFVDFAGASGADISTIAGIARIDGSANDMTISASNNCNTNSVDADGTFYQFPTTGSLAQFIQARNLSTGTAGAGLCLRGANRTNAIAVRWSTTNYTLAKREGGAWTVIGTSTGVTPAAGQTVRLEIDAAHNARVLVNGNQRIPPTAIDAATLIDLHPGLISRVAAKTPFIDDLSCGAL